MLHQAIHYQNKFNRQLTEYFNECKEASGQYLQVRECKFITYWFNANRNYHDNLQHNQKKTYSGEMTAGAKKRLTHAVENLLSISPSKTIYNPVTDKPLTFRINFITLTFPIDVPEYSTALYCLQLFIQWMREQNVKNYVWKAELTPTHNRIHYHITTNAFIHYKSIRNKWNHILKNNNMLNEYYEKHNHYNPNSTDVHACENIQDLSAYLLKYVTKAVSELENNGIHGKVWACSKSLSSSKLFSIKMPDGLWRKLQYTTLTDYFSNDFVEIYKFKNNRQRNANLPSEILNQFTNYIKSITNEKV